ncbi:MAG: BspA family leucine-rich repeat surface protein, partial [Marinifilaceae bacterium]|nr:BspA family leucine-rich repeat surface protein [Marinifilaceae bacterium]
MKWISFQFLLFCFLTNLGFSYAKNMPEPEQRPLILKYKTTRNNEDVKILINKGITSDNYYESNLSPSQYRIGVVSAYNYEVDWNNDGIYDSRYVNDDALHSYASPGEHIVRIRGTFPGLMHLNFVGVKAADLDSNQKSMMDQAKNYGSKLIDVLQWGDIEWESMYCAFSHTNIVEFSANDVPNTSKVESYKLAFGSSTVKDSQNKTIFLSKFNSSKINNWDVSGGKDFSFMFYGATCFNQDLNNWRMPEALNLGNIFWYAETFNGSVSGWGLEKLIELRSAFNRAYRFNRDLSTWNLQSIQCLRYAFYSAHDFNQNINHWNVSNLTDIRYCFMYAKSFNQPLDKWDNFKATNLRSMFNGATAFNQDISTWDLSNVTSLYYTFIDAKAFNQDISGWNLSNCQWFTYCFKGASSFNQDISNWDMSSCISIKEIFQNTSSLDIKNYSNIISAWKSKLKRQNSRVNITVNLKHYPYASSAVSEFSGKNIVIVDKGEFKAFSTRWLVPNSSKQVVIQVSPKYEYSYYIDWGDGQTEHINTNENLSHNYGVAGQYTIKICGTFPAIDFSNSSSQTNSDAILSINSWGDIKWKSFENAFINCTNLNVNSSETPNLNDVQSLKNCFNSASSVNFNISNWNMSQVNDMSGMFQNATAFNQNIGNWDISNVGNMRDIFSYSGLSIQNYDKILIAWAKKINLKANVQLDFVDSYHSIHSCPSVDVLESRSWRINDLGCYSIMPIASDAEYSDLYPNTVYTINSNDIKKLSENLFPVTSINIISTPTEGQFWIDQNKNSIIDFNEQKIKQNDKVSISNLKDNTLKFLTAVSFGSDQLCFKVENYIGESIDHKIKLNYRTRPILDIITDEAVYETDSDQNHEVIFRLNETTTVDISLNLSTVDILANVDDDYQINDNLVTIPAGELELRKNIIIKADQFDEADEDFKIVLSGINYVSCPITEKIITIKDDDSTPSLSVKEFDMNLNSEIGDIICSLNVQDDNLEDLSITVLEGAEFFSIEENSKLVLKKKLNSINPPEAIYVKLELFDLYNKKEEVVKLNIQSSGSVNPEITDKGSIEIEENSPININVYLFEGTFNGSSTSLLDGVSWIIVSGNDASKFMLNDKTGELSLVSSLDYEIKQLYTLGVQLRVSDSDESSYLVSDIYELQIKIINENDNICTINTSSIPEKIILSESELVDYELVHLSASDSDIDNSIIAWEIIGGNEADKFKIDSQGRLRLKNTIDYENNSDSKSYTLNIQAS